jgi:hypothetical protein
LVFLLETGRVDTRISENLNVERAREVAALIPDWSRSKDDQILDRVRMISMPDSLVNPQNLRESASRRMLGNAIA